MRRLRGLANSCVRDAFFDSEFRPPARLHLRAWRGKMMGMHPQTQGRFNAAALYAALDKQRRDRGMTWTQVGRELGIGPSTLTRTRLGGRMEVDGMLAMVRWLGRTVESFTFGYLPPERPAGTQDRRE
jgi:hypothetical protein